MIYYNIHSHTIPTREEINNRSIAIYCLSEEDILSRLQLNGEVRYSAGIHPWHIQSSELNISKLKDYVIDNCSRVVAIGETGLDALIDTPLAIQGKVFREQIELSQKLNLPLIIHCVKAWDLLIALHKEYKPTQSWIIHGFRGGKEQAAQLTKMGFYISLGKFYNAESLSILYPYNLLLETDDSQLPIERVYANVAKDLKIEEADLVAQIEQNVRCVFDL